MPVCIEKKLTLSGEVQTFNCELLHWEEGFCVLKYVIDRHYLVGGIALAPNDITIAIYWVGRPYTLYIWQPGGSPVYYFNIADSINLTREECRWRDLVVDILIDADLMPRILDENELPLDIPPGLSACIHSAKALVLATYRDIIKETNDILGRLPDAAIRAAAPG